MYRAVPYLLLAAPPAIFLLTVILGGCTMARTSEITTGARCYSDANGRAAAELGRDLERRAAHEELRRVVESAQQ
jgi:hypothetical protein